MLRPARPEGHLRRHGHRAGALAGRLQRRDGQRRRTTGARKRHTFATTPRMSTYLVALIAGPYARWDDTYSDEHGDIPLGLFCRKSLAEFMDAERLFTETKQGFGFYHNNFGVPYAFGKYDQLFVPEFNAGAMENAGAVTFLEDYVFRSKVTRASYERRAETVLHEMAHMWFGDLVTMQWWDDLWLNESFATFASVLCQAEATEYTEAWTTFANVGEVLGLPAGPAAVDAPGRRRHPRPGRRRGELRRHHLRQGRQRAQAAGRLRRAGGVPGRPARLLPRPRLRQRDLRRPARRAGEGVRPRPVRLGAAVAEDHRAEHAARRLRPRRRRAVHPLRDQPERCGARRRRDPGAPAGGRHLRRRRQRQAGAGAPRGARRRGRCHRSSCAARCFARQADPGQRRRPDVLLAAAGPRLAADRADPHRRHRRAAAPHAGLVGGVGDDPRSRDEGPRLRGAGRRRVCTPRPRSGWRSGCCCRPRPR